MKLKRLIIQGFKSFKDRTTINFDDGITGIVGPNGCGKSNIVDALFWVMGEQSAKHLRGKSMKDLIFSGSSKYNPGAFSEATLVLDNDTGKHIHIGNKVSSPSEIQLTRKLYRNGDTEYRINGEPARLRDIQEVFMDTGAGAKSYSIIAQGEINRLVQAKPEERRVMIEEVAGITKFKARKRESLRKIEATQLNLNRLNDLQIEIEKNLRSLQKQAEKAERARSLKEKIKRNDIVVHSHKVFESLKAYREDQNRANELEIEVETAKTQKNSLEISLEDERLQKDEQTARIEELQSEYNEISRSLAAAEEKLNYLCKTLTEKESLIETREKEIEELNSEIANRVERFEQLRQDLDTLEAQKEEGFDYSDLEESVENLKEELELKTEILDQVKESLASAKDEFAEIDQTVFRNNSRLEEFAGTLQDITTEIEALEKQYSGVSKDIANEREASLKATAKAEELAVEEKEVRLQIEDLKEDLRTKESGLKEKQRELIQGDSKLQSLIEIRESLEGTKEGMGKLLEDHPEGFVLLGTLIKCSEEYASGVQLLLKDFLKVAVCKDLTKREDFFQWLSSNEKVGLDTLIPHKDTSVTSETLERLRLKLSEVKEISEVLEMDEKIKSILAPFLNGYYIVPNLEIEKIKSLDEGMSFKGIASYDGLRSIRNVQGASLIDFSDPNAQGHGVVERNNLIEELTEKVTLLKTVVPELEEKVQFLEGDLTSLVKRHDEIRDELSDKKSEAASLSSALESKLSNMEAGHARLDILKNRKTEVSKQRFDLLENEESMNIGLEAAREKSETLSEQLEELEESVSLIRDEYSQKREELLEKQVEAKSFNERVENTSRQVQDVEGQIERQKQKLSSLQVLIEGYQTEMEEIGVQIEELEKNNLNTAEGLQEKEEVLNTLKDSLGDLLLGMKEREDQTKKLSAEVNKAEKTLVEIESRRIRLIEEEEQNVRNIFEKYRINLREGLGQYLEYQESDYEGLSDISSMFIMETEQGTVTIEPESYEFNRRYGQDLKDCEYKLKNYKTEINRLGEINWQAIEDYERQKLRFDFLKIQEEELRTSLEDLEKAISHIDEKSKQRFKIAFDEVDTRFRKVFPIIFGGGNAELKIIGDINDAECGVEIIAQPPGKKMQNINLMSGGEKAMTAVSLIFSIFLVKPSPFCLLDEVDAPLDDANVGRFNELLREMSKESQFILITHNKKTMELNDTLYGVTMQEPGVSKAVSVQLQ
ncbi:MAG: chromosome segregation protein SMC [Bacteriovoracaceae bacterium]|nr:chromosome segregation protein SMC [Bacteriovoracaceae bacterium]